MGEIFDRPMCHCGEYMDAHGSVFDTGHTPVEWKERDPDCFDAPACDCGAVVAKTTHASWCSTVKP